MMPVLLVSKNARQMEKYISDFIEKNAVADSYIFRYRKDPNVITIEQIREIKSCLLRSAGARRLFIIYDFETAKRETQTAFLKTLEEQGDAAFFILVTTGIGAAQPTIRSRCVAIKLKEKSDKKPIKDFSLKESLSNLFARYTIVKPEQGKKLLDELLDYLRREMKKSSSGGFYASAIKEIVKTRAAVIFNNLSVQMAFDHILIFLKKNLPLTKQLDTL